MDANQLSKNSTRQFEKRCLEYVDYFSRFKYVPRPIDPEREKKRRAKMKKKVASKRNKTKCEIPATLNIIRASRHLSLKPCTQSLEHQVNEILRRFPGADFSAVRLVRLSGFMKSFVEEVNEASNAEGQKKMEKGSEAIAVEYAQTLDLIKDCFASFRFWPTDKGKDDMIFWSENHMILYLSAALLLEEWGWKTPEYAKGKKYSKSKNRVIAFLLLKKHFGFFEFNSSIYITFTLSALFNLYDFSKDQVIVDLAFDAINQILESILSFTTSNSIHKKDGESLDSVFYSVTGRGYLHHRLNGSGFDINSVIYLLTGIGSHDFTVRHATTFLSTSLKYIKNMPANMLNFHKNPRKSWHIGTGSKRMVSFVANMEELGGDIHEFVPFLWSMGAYFHPAVIQHTLKFIESTSKSSNSQKSTACADLWEHPNFKAVGSISFLGGSMLRFIAKKLKTLTCGSMLCSQEVSLYKDVEADLILSSVRSREAGCVGYQKVPWIAGIGKFSVFTGSGSVQNLNGGHELVSHISLPSTKQFENIALICYHPGSQLVKLKYDSDVYAHFPVQAMVKAGMEVVMPMSKKHQEKTSLGWVFVRSGNSFVALGCDKLKFEANKKQPLTSYDEMCYWVCVLGNEGKLGSFDRFQQLCKAIRGVHRSDQLVVKCPRSLCYAEPIGKRGSSDYFEEENVLTMINRWECSDEKEFKKPVVRGEVRAAPSRSNAIETSISGGGGGGGGEGGGGGLRNSEVVDSDSESESDESDLEETDELLSAISQLASSEASDIDNSTAAEQETATTPPSPPPDIPNSTAADETTAAGDGNSLEPDSDSDADEPDSNPMVDLFAQTATRFSTIGGVLRKKKDKKKKNKKNKD